MWACFIVPSQSFHMKRLSLWRVRALFVYWCTGWDGITSMMAEALDRMLHLQRSDECCACPTSPLPMCRTCAGVSSLPDCHDLSSKAVTTCVIKAVSYYLTWAKGKGCLTSLPRFAAHVQGSARHLCEAILDSITFAQRELCHHQSRGLANSSEFVGTWVPRCADSFVRARSWAHM